MNYLNSLLILLLGIVLLSCSTEESTPPTIQPEIEIPEEKQDTDNLPEEESDSTEQAPSIKLKPGDLVVVKGILKNIRKSEYGPTWMDVEVDGEQLEITDWTGVDGFPGVKDSMIGQELIIQYMYVEFLEESDLHVNNTSVRSDWDRQNFPVVTEEDKSKPDLLKVEGKLEWSLNKYGISGDISPSEYGIIQTDGTIVIITGRVYEELFAPLNGKQATVYYYLAHELGAVSISPVTSDEVEEVEFDAFEEKSDTVFREIEY